MRKCCFIVPYFGRFPDSFKIFLKTCESNKDFNWLIFTDDRTDYAYPSNFEVNYITYEKMKSLVNQKMGFTVAMNRPYKLCDLKPAYGFLFEEYLQDYLFWAHCDIDTVMGDLGSFITDELLTRYDKLFCLGHMTLYRNTKENNRMFMSDLHGRLLYREVYTNPASCWFDEEWYDENNINQIFLSHGKRVLCEDWSTNFDVSKRKFERVRYIGRSPEANKHGYYMYGPENAMYIWKQGKIIQITSRDGKLIKHPIMYMHFQHRKMVFSQSVLDSQIFSIIPNGYVSIKKTPDTVMAFYFRKRRTLCIDYYQKQMKIYWRKIQNKVIKSLRF